MTLCHPNHSLRMSAKINLSPTRWSPGSIHQSQVAINLSIFDASWVGSDQTHLSFDISSSTEIQPFFFCRTLACRVDRLKSTFLVNYLLFFHLGICIWSIKIRFWYFLWSSSFYFWMNLLVVRQELGFSMFYSCCNPRFASGPF